MAVITGNTSSTCNFQQTKTSGFPGSAGATVNTGFSKSSLTFLNGVGAGAVNLMHWGSYSLAAAPQTIDLTALADPFGGAVAFARVRAFYRSNLSATDGQDVTEKPGGSNPWSNFWGGTTPTTLIKAGGRSMSEGPLATGWVVDSTHKTITFDPGANTIVVELCIVGADA